MESRMSISKELLEKLLTYVAQRPYLEVVTMMDAVKADVKPLSEKPKGE